MADQNRRPKFAYFHPSGDASQDSPVDFFEIGLDSASTMLNELPTYLRTYDDCAFVFGLDIHWILWDTVSDHEVRGRTDENFWF